VAEDTGRSYHEVFFDENVTPSRLIGSFDPALVVRNGRNISSFEPGPLIRAMVEGGLFVAQELNRATEFCQNSLISPLEERHYHIFPIGMVKAHQDFAFVATQNPIETAGTYTPAFSLPESALNKIYDIVNVTRNTPSLEIPASPRSGIYLTRLVNKYIRRFVDEDSAIRFFAPAVLSKEMRVKEEGKTVNIIIDEIVEKRLT
jgi:MoxR-like ATPase